MPGDWIKKRAADLIDQIDQFAAALNNAGGYTASGLTLAQFTNLLSLRDDLEAAVGTEDVQLGLYRGAVDARQATQSQVAAELRAMGMAATRHMNMTDPLRAQAGLTVRDTAPTPGILPVVDDCSVVGHPNGNNAVKWTRPAGGRGVVFEVEVSMGSSGAWTLAGATSKTSLLHTGAGAGVHRLYRIVCRRGDLRGEPGNEAAVYGS